MKSLYFNVANGVAKELKITKPTAGKLYIHFLCNNSDTEPTSYGQQTQVGTDVLNGVPYTISVFY